MKDIGLNPGFTFLDGGGWTPGVEATVQVLEMGAEVSLGLAMSQTTTSLEIPGTVGILRLENECF